MLEYSVSLLAKYNKGIHMQNTPKMDYIFTIT